ncbi:tyrosine-type recombinase/integrase [Nonomuraea sp. NPDC003707]
MSFDPCLLNGRPDPADPGVVRLGHPALDDYLELVAARARPNTLIATAYDLKVFFSQIRKDPAEVTTVDVLAFIKMQRSPRIDAKVVRLEDGEAGLSARTIKRRLASICGLFNFLVVRGDVRANPVPQGLAARRPGQRAIRQVPLIRTPRTLPRVLEPGEVSAFLAALRTRRDRAMAEAMLLGGLRRCEVLGLRLGDLRPGEHRVFRSPWCTTWRPACLPESADSRSARCPATWRWARLPPRRPPPSTGTPTRSLTKSAATPPAAPSRRVVAVGSTPW